MEKEDSLRTKIIGLRLTGKEYKQIEKQLKNSTAKKMSDYVRYVLFDKPITVYQRNQSLDDFMTEMINLIAEFKSWIITYELEKKILFYKVDEIKNRINKIADEWLQ